MTSREYEPLRMNTADRNKVAQDYADLTNQVFVVKDQQRLFNNVANPQSDVIKVRIFRNSEGKPVGFFKVNVDYGERNGRKYAAFSAHAGFLRKYRGGSSTIFLGLKTLLSQILMHPSWDIFYFGILLHPSSYSLFSRSAIEYWPRWDQPTPPEQLKFLCGLADVYAKPESIYNPEQPLVRNWYLGTKTLEQEGSYWRSSEKDTVKYFLRVNPRYAQGAGVFTWIKLDGRLFRKVLLEIIRDRLQRTLLSIKASMMKSRLGKAMLPKPDIVALLRTVPLFAGLPDRAIEILAQSADTMLIKAGTKIIQQGELGDGLYVIVQGSAYVLMRDAEEEQIIDQLSKGAIFGEMSLLSGEPRSASVRAATAVVAVKVGRAAFGDFLRLNSSIEDDLWALFGKRRFDVYLLGQERFRDLRREHRIGWYESGECRKVDSGAVVTVQSTKCAFLVTGSVEVKLDGAWLGVSAPALIEFGKIFEVRSNAKSRICLLDKPEVG